jgi:hypothetical protein
VHYFVSGLTVSVTGGGAGVDNAWEQRKLEAKNMLFWRENPRRPVHALLARNWGVVESIIGMN